METEDFELDIKNCVRVLDAGGIILYPTDTIWGLGCDARNEKAVEKIIELKKRALHKSFVVLMSDVTQVRKYIAIPPPDLEALFDNYTQPTTIVFEHALALAQNVLAQDGSLGIRIPQEKFCKALLKRFRAPIVSTSVNISNQNAAISFSDIPQEFILNVDYSVTYRQNENIQAQASSIIKIQADGSLIKIR